MTMRGVQKYTSFTLFLLISLNMYWVIGHSVIRPENLYGWIEVCQ